MSAYLGFSADLAAAKAKVESKAAEWGDDFKAAQAVVANLHQRTRDQLAAEYLVYLIRQTHGDEFKRHLPQHIERSEKAVTSYGETRNLLNTLQVTSKQVKIWAVEVGLIEKVVQGRVHIDLVRAYAIAHVPKGEPLPEELEEQTA